MATSNGELIVIENENGPNCGPCNSTKIAAYSDGHIWIEHGHWAGEYRDWQITRRLQRATSEQFARFREHLRPFRPEGELDLTDTKACKTYWADSGGVRVEWYGSGSDAFLRFDFGCDPDIRQAMAEALKTAPRELGVTDLPWP